MGAWSGPWTRREGGPDSALVLQSVSGRRLAGVSWAAVTVPTDSVGARGVKMLESVLWTGRGPLGGSQPGVKRPCVLPSATHAQGGLSGMFSLHQGPKTHESSSRESVSNTSPAGSPHALPATFPSPSPGGSKGLETGGQREGRNPGNERRQRQGLGLVKSHRGPDALIILMRPCFCDSTGLGKLFF